MSDRERTYNANREHFLKNARHGLADMVMTLFAEKSDEELAKIGEYLFYRAEVQLMDDDRVFTQADMLTCVNFFEGMAADHIEEVIEHGNERGGEYAEYKHQPDWARAS